MITRKRASKASSAAAPRKSSSEPYQYPPSSPASSANPVLPVNSDAEATRIQAQHKRVTDRIDRFILEIFTKDPEEWLPQSKALYDKVSRERKGIKALGAKLKATAEESVNEARRVADIMKRLPIVDPDEHQNEFMVFKARRIARLLQKNVSISCRFARLWGEDDNGTNDEFNSARDAGVSDYPGRKLNIQQGMEEQSQTI
jgi:hypothetical protein